MRIGFAIGLGSGGVSGTLPFRGTWVQSVSLVDTTVYNQVVGTYSGADGVEPYSYSKVSGSTELTINPTTGAVTFNGTADKDSPEAATFRVTDSTGTPQTYDLLVTLSVGLLQISSVSWSPPAPTINPDNAPLLASTATPTGGYAPYSLVSIDNADYNNPAGTALWLNNPARADQVDVVGCSIQDAEGQLYPTSVTVTLDSYVAISDITFSPASPVTTNADDPTADLLTTMTAVDGQTPVSYTIISEVEV